MGMDKRVKKHERMESSGRCRGVRMERVDGGSETVRERWMTSPYDNTDFDHPKLLISSPVQCSPFTRGILRFVRFLSLVVH